jgi:hypothetical protein
MSTTEKRQKIDPYFLEHPYYRLERMGDYLNMDLGYKVKIKRIRRLYRNEARYFSLPSQNKDKNQRELHLSLLTSQFKNNKSKSGLANRYHLHANV